MRDSEELVVDCAEYFCVISCEYRFLFYFYVVSSLERVRNLCMEVLQATTYVMHHA